MQRGGYQLDLSSSPALRTWLGFLEGLGSIPKGGCVNEYSGARDNHRLVYRYWNASIAITSRNSKLQLRAWNNVSKVAESVGGLNVPGGLYTPAALVSAINAVVAASTYQVGLEWLSQVRFELAGDAVLAGVGRVNLAVNRPGVRVMVGGEESFLAGSNSLGFAEGAEELPEPSVEEAYVRSYHGTYKAVPNEVSINATNDYFFYRQDTSEFNISFPPGVYNLSAVERVISEGTRQNHGDSSVFKFWIDSEGHVVMDILRLGYQALFSRRDSIGRFLGFIDMDLPCKTNDIQSYLNDLSDAATSSAAPGTYCIKTFKTESGLTNNVSRIRAYFARPMVSGVLARGACVLNGSAGLCACRDGERACISRAEALQAPGQVTNVSSCSCEARRWAWSVNGSSQWGSLTTYSTTIRPGIYNSFWDLDSEVQDKVRPPTSQTGGSPLSLTANLSSSKLLLILQVTQRSGGFQIDVNASSLLTHLGFRAGMFPTTLAVFGSRYILEAEVAKPKVVAGQEEEVLPADLLGEYVDKIALGDEHTLVLSKANDNTECDKGRCCDYR